MLAHNQDRHHRRSIRLRGYDYSQAGAYFVPVCVHGHECAPGQVVDSRGELNDGGQIVFACLDDLPNHYPHVQLDAFATMPNYVHGIVLLLGEDRVTAADVVGRVWARTLFGTQSQHTKPAPARCATDTVFRRSYGRSRRFRHGALRRRAGRRGRRSGSATTGST